MNRNHLRALLIAASTLVATGAYADNPHGKPPGAEKAGEKAADKAEKGAEKAADKAADKSEKAADKADKAGKDAVDPSKAKTADDRAARKAKEHDAQRDKLKTTWKGPVSEALRQELRRHAERLARLERIKAVAETEKDKDSAEKATKLIEKENERHEKWMGKHASEGTPAAAPANGKEGAK